MLKATTIKLLSDAAFSTKPQNGAGFWCLLIGLLMPCPSCARLSCHCSQLGAPEAWRQEMGSLPSLRNLSACGLRFTGALLRGCLEFDSGFLDTGFTTCPIQPRYTEVSIRLDLARWYARSHSFPDCTTQADPPEMGASTNNKGGPDKDPSTTPYSFVWGAAKRRPLFSWKAPTRYK